MLEHAYKLILGYLFDLSICRDCHTKVVSGIPLSAATEDTMKIVGNCISDEEVRKWQWTTTRTK